MPSSNMSRNQFKFMFFRNPNSRLGRPRKAMVEPAPVEAPSYPLYSYDLTGAFVRGYQSVAAAKEHLHLADVSHIYKALLGKRPTAFGYQWSRAPLHLA